jgi:hypothetical protein
MKSFIASVSTVIVLATGFATSALAASFSEAPEFKPSVSTLTRASVAMSALGAAAVSEATQFSASKSTLNRQEVCKEVTSATAAKFNELTASNLN